MQNQSNNPSQRQFNPMSLPADFPICTGGVIHQYDGPIKYLHAHDCLEVGYCHSGSGVFVVENKVTPFSCGDVSFISSGEMHYARSLAGSISSWTFIFMKPSELLCLHGDLKYTDCDYLTGSNFNNIIPSAKFSDISSLIRELIEEVENNGKGRKQLILNLVSTLLIKINRIYPDLAEDSFTSTSSTRHRILPALDLILHEFDRPISIHKLAARCHMSVSHFRRLFCCAMGVSPQEYMITFRIKLAQRMLRATTKSILEISMEVGYSTLSSFNRHFKRLTTMTPKDWRKINKQEE